MYAAMGAPYAGFGTSIMVDESVPQEGMPAGPASAQPPPAPAGPAPTGNGLQSGTTREVPLHMQQAEAGAAPQAMTNGSGGVPWLWIAVGVGGAAFALWAWNRRSRAR
jgi:hypothetical protein